MQIRRPRSISCLSFDFDRDAPKIYAIQTPFKRSAWDDISARSPHLEGLRAHGGKMIVYQGASDPVFSLNDTLAWYREVEKLNGKSSADFVRVFPVPGMAHCGGGPSTDQFDPLGALVDWVEKGSAPDRIVAKAGADESVARTHQTPVRLPTKPRITKVTAASKMLRISFVEAVDELSKRVRL